MTRSSASGGISFLSDAGEVEGFAVSSGSVRHAEAARNPTAMNKDKTRRRAIRRGIVTLLNDDGSTTDEDPMPGRYDR
jgi:hypothetical protein